MSPLGPRRARVAHRRDDTPAVTAGPTRRSSAPAANTSPRPASPRRKLGGRLDNAAAVASRTQLNIRVTGSFGHALRPPRIRTRPPKLRPPPPGRGTEQNKTNSGPPGSATPTNQRTKKSIPQVAGRVARRPAAAAQRDSKRSTEREWPRVKQSTPVGPEQNTVRPRPSWESVGSEVGGLPRNPSPT